MSGRKIQATTADLSALDLSDRSTATCTVPFVNFVPLCGQKSADSKTTTERRVLATKTHKSHKSKNSATSEHANCGVRLTSLHPGLRAKPALGLSCVCILWRCESSKCRRWTRMNTDENTGVRGRSDWTTASSFAKKSALASRGRILRPRCPAVR